VDEMDINYGNRHWGTRMTRRPNAAVKFSHSTFNGEQNMNIPFFDWNRSGFAPFVSPFYCKRMYRSDTDCMGRGFGAVSRELMSIYLP
jgi:hypothetical protein